MIALLVMEIAKIVQVVVQAVGNAVIVMNIVICALDVMAAMVDMGAVVVQGVIAVAMIVLIHMKYMIAVPVQVVVHLKMLIIMVANKTLVFGKKYIVIVMQLVYHVLVAGSVQVVTVAADNALANAILMTNKAYNSFQDN